MRAFTSGGAHDARADTLGPAVDKDDLAVEKCHEAIEKCHENS